MTNWGCIDYERNDKDEVTLYWVCEKCGHEIQWKGIEVPNVECPICQSAKGEKDDLSKRIEEKISKMQRRITPKEAIRLIQMYVYNHGEPRSTGIRKAFEMAYDALEKVGEDGYSEEESV